MDFDVKGEHGLAELSPVFPALNKGVPAYLHLIGVDKFFSSHLVTLSSQAFFLLSSFQFIPQLSLGA